MLGVNSEIADFNIANAITDLFKIKRKITGQTGNNDTKSVKIILPFKYLNNFGELLKWYKLTVKLILI